jgi:23S rRNA-/tRNA-specific pseudouridylate synthase
MGVALLIGVCTSFKRCWNPPQASPRAAARYARISSDEFEVSSRWRVKTEAPMRIDDFLSNADSSSSVFSSSTSAKKWLRKGLITVNGEVTKSIDALVHPNDLIEQHMRVSRATFPEEVAADIYNNHSVLWEDDYMAVMLKPQGVTFDEMNSISFRLLKPPSANVPECLRRPAVVHRLDRPVGGLILVAKTNRSLRTLSELFAQRKVVKKYVALVAGAVEGGVGTEREIDIPLGGKSSQTLIVVDRIDECACSHDGYISQLSVYPKTGRNHQIRKHLSIIKHPIIGDDKYWFKSADRESECSREKSWRSVHAEMLTSSSRGIGGIGLWSTRLEFTVPGFGSSSCTGELIQVEIPLEETTIIASREQLTVSCGEEEE